MSLISIKCDLCRSCAANVRSFADVSYTVLALTCYVDECFCSILGPPGNFDTWNSFYNKSAGFRC